MTGNRYLSYFLLGLGAFSFARFLLKTTLVFLQTFLLPGKDVSLWFSICLPQAQCKPRLGRSGMF